VVGNFLRPVEKEHEADGRHDDHTEDRADSRQEGLVLLLAGANNASDVFPGVLDGLQDSAPATGQPRPPQAPHPTEVLAATTVDKDRPIQHTGARVRLAARALELGMLAQVLAGMDDSMIAGRHQGDEIFAWDQVR
jgi:hypothetical protein